MSNLWPWLAVAGIGALHGLSPANGWMFAAAWGVHSRDAAQVRLALLPIAVGHAASVAVVACAFALGVAVDRTLFQGLAGALLVGAAAICWLRGAASSRAGQGDRIHTAVGKQAGHAGIALWSFLMASAHGAGLMLVPALVPLCLADNPAREITASGSLAVALAAVGVHTAAMLVTTGVVATGAFRGIATQPRLLNSAALHQAWTATLAVTGALLLVLR